MKGTFETGRKFSKSSELRLDFFKSGVIRAVVRATGINAVSREQSTRSVITGRRTGRPVSTEAGTGSNAQDLTLQDLRTVAMYAVETLSKDVRSH